MKTLAKLALSALLFNIACNTKEAPPSPPPKAPPAAPAEDKSKIPAPPDVAAAPADAEKTPTGLASRVLSKGTGTEHPAPQDVVKVHYTGWMAANGKMSDSSVVRGEPISFSLSQVIPGWTEGVQLMVQGEKRRLWIPGTLGYGDKDLGNGRPFGMLVFDIELLSIK